MAEPPVDDHDTTLTKANALSYRVRVTQRSLLRSRPTLATIEEKRLENYYSAVAAEKYFTSQLFSGDELIQMLAAQMRSVQQKIDATAMAKAAAATSEMPRPTRHELLKLLHGSASGFALPIAYELDKLDLSFTLDLAGCVLAPATSLDGASLVCAELSSCDMSRASLLRASLAFAVGQHTTLAYAHAAHADLSHCRLTSGVFDGADLRAADLRGSNLSTSSLRGTLLDDASLLFTNLSGCDCTGFSVARCRLAGVLGLGACTLDNLRGAVLCAVDGTPPSAAHSSPAAHTPRLGDTLRINWLANRSACK